ncbi:MAG: SET domain-containing protein, partial [Cytophagales bacterium]|nr:SET domain-containing protein [Cytophagales bacterium]
MLLITTSLRPSPIGGLGLYSEEYAPKGTRIWQNGTDSELIITKVEFEFRSLYMQDFIRHYGYFDEMENKWKLPLDNSRFMNHSDKPNLGQDVEGNNYALEDIFPGDELTCDYRAFEPENSR